MSITYAEDLLNSLDTSNSSEESHIVIGKDRFITVPDELKRLAVQYDHNIETVTFDCPRYWDEHDMSTMGIYINYLRSDNTPGVYVADNVIVDDTDSSIIHFNWTISKHVTMSPGKIVFLICIKNIEEDGSEKNHWNSELCDDCYISKGMENDEVIIEEIYLDYIEQWRQEVLSITNEAENILTSITENRDNGDFDGATFIPSVSDTGYISWTNDKGLENPETKNIKGPQGLSPTIKVTDITNGHRITITDINGTESFDVMNTELSGEAAEQLRNNLVEEFISAKTSVEWNVMYEQSAAIYVETSSQVTIEDGLKLYCIPDETIASPFTNTISINGSDYVDVYSMYNTNKLELGCQNDLVPGKFYVFTYKLAEQIIYDGVAYDYPDRFELELFTEDPVKPLFSSNGKIVTMDYYGDTLPLAGIPGRIFFKKVSS